MPIFDSLDYTTVTSGALIAAFLFLSYAFLIGQQNSKLNWAVFYSTLYTAVTLPIVNYFCVELELWKFQNTDENIIGLPYELYFLWIVLWGMLPMYLARGKHLLLLSVLVIWTDLLIMPQLENVGALSLGKYWLIGEWLIVITVFAPAYYWAACSYKAEQLAIRAFIQVGVMGCLFLIGLPFLLHAYGLVDTLELRSAPITFQVFLIIVFPSLVGVIDLVSKGHGTPFPYDPTQKLVRTGVYAYCRNPIQWTFTLMFIPLSIYYSSEYLLLGVLVSIAYTVGISDYHENDDMRKRFGLEWEVYKSSVPKWRFLWKPTQIPQGQIFFDLNCIQCSQVREWIQNRNPINLAIKTSVDFQAHTILQVTYIDHNGLEFRSVNAIACALEHIHLGYATLGWFMRFPGLNNILQVIIDTMEFSPAEDGCEVS